MIYPSSPTESDSGALYGNDDDDPYTDLNWDSSPIPFSDLDGIQGNVLQPHISHAIESFNKIHSTSVSHLNFQQQGLVYLHQISRLRANYCVERMGMRRRGFFFFFFFFPFISIVALPYVREYIYPMLYRVWWVIVLVLKLKQLRRRVAERFLQYLLVLGDEYTAAIRSAYHSRAHVHE